MGPRHRLIDQALRVKVRPFVSDYILDELADLLREELNETSRYAHLARRALEEWTQAIIAHGASPGGARQLVVSRARFGIF